MLHILACLLNMLFVALTMSNDNGLSSIPVVFAQTHQMTTSGTTLELIVVQKKSTFSAIGQISSLVITVPEADFNITNAFKVILTREWNLSVNKGKITNFAANFLASPMDGTKAHLHQITNLKSTSGKPIELTADNSLSVNATADIKINGVVVWEDARISIIVSNGRTINIDPDDKDTENHFGSQAVYGMITRLIS